MIVCDSAKPRNFQILGKNVWKVPCLSVDVAQRGGRNV